MTLEYYVRKGNKELRYGYTTGTCAALAADIATRMLLTGDIPEQVSIKTQKGITVSVAPGEYGFEGDSAWAGVLKDGGDDVDITDGMLICARVRKSEGENGGVSIDGGKGVGRVTRPGLDQPVGNAAINSGPRSMITSQVNEACGELGYKGGMDVIIFVPEGEKAAKKTFNSNLGIENGISILGTTGIVEPMSEKALVDTIELEMKQDGLKTDCLILTPGNYGMDHIRKENLDKLKDPRGEAIPILKFSNYLGETLDMLTPCGIKNVLLVSHAGKLIKTAGGIMNTHSSWADCRREIICAHSALAGGSRKLAGDIMEAATTDACFDLLEEEGLLDEVISSVMKEIQEKIQRRAGEDIKIGALMFSNVRGTLGITEEGLRILEQWKYNGMEERQ